MMNLDNLDVNARAYQTISLYMQYNEKRKELGILYDELERSKDMMHKRLVSENMQSITVQNGSKKFTLSQKKKKTSKKLTNEDKETIISTTLGKCTRDDPKFLARVVNIELNKTKPIIETDYLNIKQIRK